MNKIFKVIWCKSSQVWIAVSELSKVKAISSTSTENKPTSSHSNFIKTIAISLPIATIPSIANAVIGIDTITNGYAYNTGTAVAEQVDSNTTWAYDYKNPGNKSYYDANNPSDRTDGYSSLNQAAYGVAIGRYTNAQNRTQASNGIAIGDYAQATGGLATSIGAFSQAEDIGSTAIGTASRAKGFNSLAMMRQSAAIGDYSAAIGSVAYAKGKASFAFGASATANGNQSIAIGNSAPRTIPGAAEAGNEAQRTKYDGLNNTQTNGERSVAIGSGAQTNGNDSFAFGSLAKTGSFYQGKDGYLGENVTRTADAAEKAIAFGTSAMATGNASVAFGYNALGGETNAIAFGVESKAHKADSIAFGSNSNATQANSIAFGSNAQALHENVITIGKDSKATKKGAMTIGESAQSNANNSLALGNGTIINQEDIKNPNAKYTNDSFDIENGVVAIANKGKERRLVNLAAGREDTDAVNVKQLTEVNDNLAKSIAGENYNGYSVDATGRYSYKAPDFNIKNQTLHNVKDAVELAQTNYVSVNADKTKQTDADSNYDNLGAKAAGSIALGEFTGTSATATDSVAIGHNTKVNGQNTVAIGANITAATNGSVILGDSSKADGSHATETVASKEIDGHTYTFAGKAKDAGRFVSVGEKGDERQIKNVAAGHVETNSTDAINGSQLYAVASHVAQGLNFQGDNSDVTVKRQLGETLNVTGGADKNNLSDNNIGVVGAGSSSTSKGGLTVKLAKDLKGLNSVETKEIKLGDNNSNTTIKYEGDRIKYGDKTVANLDDEKHIKPGEYTVDNNGDVTMTYVDGNNKDVANEKAVIKGIAKNDLSNINNDGKKVITGLGSVVKAGRNVTVDTETNATTGQKTFTVNAVAQSLGDVELAYKSNSDAATKKTVKVSEGLDFTNGNFTTASVAENGVVKYDVNIGEIEHGANGKDGKPGVKGNDGLATVKTVVDAINNSGWLANATKSTGELEGTSTATKVKPGAVVNFDAGKNLTVKQQINGDNHTYTYSLNKDIEVENVVVTGKDGKDGKIGLNGKDGTNGKDGKNRVDIQVEKGVDGVDGKNGADGISRVVYEDGKGKHTVATMEDGLKFKGDDSTVIAKKLNEQLDIIGGATKADLTDNNIGVNHDNGKLKVQLAKNLNLTDTGSIKFGDNNLNINKDGLTINNGPSVTKDGINAGDKAITNVKAGTNATDAVNVSQLDAVKTAERHIKPGEYAVDNSGNVTMTYLDGNGQDVANEKAVITGVAKNDLSNITDAGKKVITGLGSVVKAGQNVTVDTDTDATTGQKTYTVNAIAQNLGDAELAYKSNGDAATKKTVKVSDGLDFTNGNFTTASVDENGVVKYDVNVGEIENGANGKDGKPGVKGNDGLATVKTVVDAINNSGWLANATKSTGELEGTSTATKVKPGAVVNFDAGKNLKVKQTINGDDHTYTYSLDSNLTNLDKVVVNGKDGANGKDGVTITGPNGTKGEDGKVGITGKDGKNAVSIAGKDGVGHIGLTGPKGADGSDGKSIDISTNDGTQTLVNQEPGTDKSQRIVYTPKDKDGNPIKGADGKDIVREVATMDDGLKFKGDDSTVIAKKLNEQLDIIGGADKDKLTDNNIGVNSKDGKLNVQLSKDIDLTNDGSIKFGDNTLNINKDGLTINNGPSITKDGIDGGNKQIKNVQEGTDDNDVVTVKQLKGSKTIIENGKNTTVTGVGTSADPYKVNVEGALKDITSITNKDGNGKVEFAGDQVVNVAGDNSIKLDAKTGDITGLTNKTIDGSDFATKGRAATEEQLKATGDQVTNNLTKKGLNFGTQSTEVIHKNLGEKLEIVGEGTEADDRYDATNIKTMTKDGKVVVGLAKDITADKVTVGQKGEPGKDGVDGQIGVNGKDGSAVVLNGKDGSIGLNGKDGANGVSIKGDQGPAGVDGAAGETKNRIVYEYKDPKDPSQTIKEDVATLNDGLKFAGDDGQTDSSKVIAKKLNQQVDIVGGADKDKLTDNNIGVNNDNGKLKVQLAKDVNLTQDGSVTIGDTAVNNDGLTITGGPSITKGGINAGDKQITNVDSGLKNADGTKVALKDAEGDTLNNAVNVGDLKESISNITDSGFGLTDENGKDVKAKLGETVTVKGDGSVTTKVIEEDGKAKLQVGLNKDVTIGNDKDPGTITVKGENGKDGISINGKDGTIGLKGEDGKDGIALNGKDGTIGLKGKDGKDGIALNGKDGTIGINGKDGSNGKITVAQGQAGLDGNDGKDGKTKTRIVYEKPNGDKKEVATLNDGLRFTGNNEVENSHKLNSLVTIKGEGVDKAASEKFESAAGNVNVKAYGEGTLEVQLAKDLKNIDSISNKDGQKIEFKDGGTTISGGNVSVAGNNITHVKAGKDDTDAVNVKQLKDGIAQATTKVAAGKNVNVTSDKNPDGSTTYTVATKDDVDFTSVTTGNTSMNDGGITIKAAEGGKTNVTLTNKGLDNGGNKVVNVADGDINAKSKDAVNGSQLHNTKVELTNKGLDFGAQSGADIHKNLGEKLEIVGEGTKADDRYDATNIKTMTKDGKVVIGLDKDLKSDSVTVGSVGKDGKPGVDGKVGVNGKDGSSVVINGKDGSIGLTGPKGADGKSPSITVRTENGTTTVNEKDAGKPVERIKYTDSNNNTREVATLDDGLKFTGDDGKTVNRTLGSNLNIKGGAKDATSKDNIRITNDGKNGLKVQLANNVTLDNNGSVNIGGTRVDNNGITTNNGKGPSVTNNGVNAGNQKITNVKDGAVNATSKDAVNGSQLHRAVQNIDNKFGDVYGKMNKINKEARAGIAGANAAAGLPQVYLPGKSMVAASAGTFKGQNALAIGYSRSSDNGKVILKLQGNANTQGDVGGSVGVGYQW